MQESELKQRTANSLFWSVLNNGTLQVLNILFGVVLARLLTPGDYGIVGVLTIFSLLAGNLQSSGFTQGLINLEKPTARDYNSVFWFNIIVSFALYAILWFCAPMIAAFFHQPVLVPVSRFVFLAFVISSFGIAHAAYLNKNMMNREVAICNLVALLCSGTTGVALAFKGYAYWSLAWQQVIYITVLNLGRYHFVPWHPSLKVSFEPVRRMFGFSVNILFTNVINTLSGQILTFVFGRMFTIGQVGNFSQANKWNTQAHTFVSGTMHQVVQTVMVSVDNDRARQRNIFRKMIRFTSFLSFPVMLGLTFVAREFVLVLLGDRWVDSIVQLQILSLAGAFMPFYIMFQNMTIGRKRGDIYLWCNVAQIVLQLALIIAVYRFVSHEIEVVVTAYSIFMVAWLAVWQAVANRLLDLRWRDTARDILPFMLIAATVFAITHFLTLWIHGNVARLVAKVLIGAAGYIAAMKLSGAAIFKECIAFARTKFLKK